MDKYEYKVRADEIKALIAQGEYQQAAEIADTIDWRRVKSVMMLCTISDVYKINRRYEESRDMLLLAYDRHPGSRPIVYSLCELSIKMGEIVQAVEYFKEFMQVAPNDSGRYILQYKLYEAQDVGLEERIAVLEKLKGEDRREKWMYELAYLYHRVGLGTQCVEACDELILWFWYSEGKYVIKAMELKMLHAPLTPEQQQRYDSRFEGAPALPEETAENEETSAPEQTGEAAEEKSSEETVQQEPLQTEDRNILNAPTVRIPSEEIDIQVKTMDVGQYNTINLQKELAEGVKAFLDEKASAEQDEITRTLVAPMMEPQGEASDSKTVEKADADGSAENAAKDEMPTESEVFFGETEEMPEAVQPSQPENPQGRKEMPAAKEALWEAPREELTGTEEFLPDDEPVKDTAAIVMDQMRREAVAAQPPKDMAQVLAMESDGQLSLVMPEKEQIEKQITGQISIEDILAEWERMKKENEEKRAENVRQRILQDTGNLFTEFEAAIRDGLLEKLEKEENTGKKDQPAGDASESPADESEESGSAVTEGGDIAFEEPPETEEPTAEESETTDDQAEELTQIEEEEEIYQESEEAAEDILSEEQDIIEETEEFFDAEKTETNAEADGVSASEGESEQEQAAQRQEASIRKEHVQREKAPVRSLSREERELFGSFIQGRSSKEQLIHVIDGISMAAYTGNVIITGEEETNILTLAKNLVREVRMTDSNFSGRLAKISGSSLNKKSVKEVLGDLANGALIILKASAMSGETVNDMYKVLQREDPGVIVFMLDNRKAMEKLLDANPKLQELFTARMDVEALSNDALVAFGKRYAKEKEYSIDALGVLALHTRITDMQTSDHAVTILEVKEIMDDAIYSANRRTIGHFFDILTAKRYDDEDMIILREKDFM